MGHHTNLDEQWRQYLSLLAPDGRGLTFQTFDETGEDRRLARVISGSPERVIAQLYALHAIGRVGIYCTVNETDGQGRKTENIVRVRAVFREADDPDLPPLPLQPGMTIESSPGHRHEYLLIEDEWPADEQGNADFTNVMARMIATYGSCPGAKDVSRVLRLPGFLHRKTNTPHLVRIINANGKRYSRAEICAAFPPLPKQEPPAFKHTAAGEVSGAPSNKIRGILAAVAGAHEGSHNSIIYWAANRIGEMLHDCEIDRAQAANTFEALRLVGQRIGHPPHRVASAIKSARKRQNI